MICEAVYIIFLKSNNKLALQKFLLKSDIRLEYNQIISPIINKQYQNSEINTILYRIAQSGAGYYQLGPPPQKKIKKETYEKKLSITTQANNTETSSSNNQFRICATWCTFKSNIFNY